MNNILNKSTSQIRLWTNCSL